MHRLLKCVLTSHWLLTLAVMCLCALAFGLISLNLFAMLRANLDLISAHGAMALFDGALEQLVQLAVYGGLSVVVYVLFKACERVLVERILS